MSMRNVAAMSGVLAAIIALPSAARGVERPFMLWTRADLATLKRRVETEDWARRAYEALPPPGSKDAGGFPNLIHWAVTGDKQAAEAETRALLSGRGGRHGEFLNPFRFDLLHSRLSDAERAKVLRTFRDRARRVIDFQEPWAWNRYSWLPNLAYPWILTGHLMAAATGDEALMRAVFASPRGLKWYFDDYLSDMGFYNEEFGKMFATPHLMMLWCTACEHQGLDEIGFDYRGARGATMRGHMETLLRLGMPAVDLGTGRPHVPRLTMGDAKGSRGLPGYGFQHALVPGRLVDDTPHRPDGFRGSMPQDFWFEMAHARWPEMGFGWLLAGLRGLDEEKYVPSLLFGLEPIGPADAAPPPAPSGVYPGRGLVVLWAEEGPAYWTGPGPAVGLRLATPYAHHIQDCFALTGFYAFNRPIFVNHQHSSNYSGVDPGYSNSSRSHSIVRVDFAEPKTIGEVPTRHDFSPAAKFVAARAYGVYDEVDQTRALVLTGEYLLDVSRLASPYPRHYQWIIQTFGHACPDRPAAWTDSQDLVGSLFDLARERSLETDETWAVEAVQTSLGAHPEFSGLGPAWFERRVGVRTTVLGAPGTTAYHAWAPVVLESAGEWRGRDRFAYGEDEPAAVTIAAVRKTPATTFVAVHEPFETARRIRAIERVAETPDGDAFVLRITADAWTDYVCLALGEKAGEPVTLEGEGGRFTFTGYAYLRLSGGTRTTAGSFDALEAPAAKPEPARGPIQAWWHPATPLCLPTGDLGARTLTLRNAGQAPLSCTVRLVGRGGLVPMPDEIALEALAPGAERTVEVPVCAQPARENALLRVDLEVEGAEDVQVQRAPLRVANGVAQELTKHWPADFARTIYAPRYVAKYHYMESGAAGLLLDPDGLRRSDASANTYPMLVRHGTDSRGRQGWQARRFGKFAYFIPVLVPGEGGGPALIYEGGRHAHGTQSGIEHWFTEDWIVCRFRDARDGERIAFDWDPDARKMDLARAIRGRRESRMKAKAPGTILVASRDGKMHPVEGEPGDWPRRVKLPKGLGDLAAVFIRPHGYRYGGLRLYPPEARLEGRYVTMPGGAPMGFTFCLEAEAADLAGRWLAETPTGEARPIERGTYNGAFMPHLEPPPDD